jgi:hypothetical protein
MKTNWNLESEISFKNDLECTSEMLKRIAQLDANTQKIQDSLVDIDLVKCIQEDDLYFLTGGK